MYLPLPTSYLKSHYVQGYYVDEKIYSLFSLTAEYNMLDKQSFWPRVAYFLLKNEWFQKLD